jgi:hypothetical protein
MSAPPMGFCLFDRLGLMGFSYLHLLVTQAYPEYVLGLHKLRVQLDIPMSVASEILFES